MIIKKLTLLFLLFCSLFAFRVSYANEKNLKKEASFDSSIEFFYGAGFLELGLAHTSDFMTNPSFVANPPVDVGFAYTFLGKYGFSVSSSLFGQSFGYMENSKKYGETKGVSLSFYYFSKKFGIDFFYKDYKGFYRDETNEIYSNLRVINAGFNATYVFSDTFSFEAAVYFTKQQKKSAATWLISLGFGHVDLSNNGASIIPSDMKSYYSDIDDFSSFKWTYFSLMGGGAFLLTPNKGRHFIMGSLMIGPSPLLSETEDEKRFNLGLRVNIKLSFGHNGASYYCAMVVQGDQANTPYLGDTHVNVVNVDISMVFGYRF